MAILDQLREEFAPIMTPDLDTYLQAIASMFSEVELYSAPTDDYDGWQIMFDYQRAPYGALRFLGQIIGVDVPVGMPDADARQLIKDRPRWRRGTTGAIIEAAQRTLTDTRRVRLFERSSVACPSEPAYGLTVITYTGQTPDPAATEAAIRAVKPGGIVLNYQAVDGQTWEQVRAGYADWQTVKDNFGSWESVRVDTP